MTTEKKLMSLREAGLRLGIEAKTVKAWLLTGRLKGERVPYGKGRKTWAVDPASLKDAFKVKCLWCGRVFKAKHPGMAKYCPRIVSNCKDQYLYAHRNDPAVRRFKKRKKGEA